MTRWLVLAALSLRLAPAWGQPQDNAARILEKKFTPQEQILLAGVLAEPAAAREFDQDAAASAGQAVLDQWRQRIALFSRQYLDGPHPLNESARSVKDMVTPSEWEMLMVSMRMLGDGGIRDQATFHIFYAMLANADSDLAADPPDSRSARKVVALGRSRLSKAMNEYLASPAGQAALSEALKQRAMASQAPVPKISAKAARQVEKAAGAMRVAASDKIAGRLFDGSREGGLTDHAPLQLDGSTPPNPPVLGPSDIALGRRMPMLRLAPPPPADDMAELRGLNRKVSGRKKWLTELLGVGGGWLLRLKNSL